MSDSHLPDDPARWPRDPFALLGVDRQVDRRELRRAYTRLIRRFKPEHFPEQFRRIRDAYESLEHYLEYQAYSPVEENIAAEEPAVDPTSSQPAELAEATENADAPPVPPAARPAAVDRATAAWRQAVEGRLDEAYRGLRDLVQQQPNDADLYARLYWLLVLHPQLDPARDRRQWLATGLPATGFDGRLAELYDRELLCDPQEVLQPRCRKMLECRSPLAPWARFTARCWEFTGLLRRWEVIAQDLKAVREEVAAADRMVWARLLLAAAEQFLWQDDAYAHRDLAGACRQELDKHGDEHRELSYELDRCDYLAVLTAGWRKLTAGHRADPEFLARLRDLLRCSWVQPFPAILPRLLRLLRPMVENPQKGLDDLDLVQEASPVVLYQLNTLVETLYRQRHDFAAAAEGRQAADAIKDFCGKRYGAVYERVRRDILFYCIASGTTVEQFRAAAENVPLLLRDSEMREKLRRDLPLRCLAAACQAFWS